MTESKASASRPSWRKHHTVAAILLTVGVFASTVVGANAGSTITRADEQDLKVAQLAVAADVSYLLTENGELYSQGLNNFGQLGVGSLENRANWSRVKFNSEEATPVIEKVSTKGEHVLALDSNGGLWSWGSGNSSALGNGSDNPVITPAKMTVSYSFSQLQAGDDFVVALDSRGSLYTWGQNSQGQLGNDTTQAVAGPSIIDVGVSFKSIAAGKNYAFAIDKNDALWAWGANSDGQFGNGTTTNSLVPVKVSDGPWSSVTASRFNNTVMAINTNGELWSWGSNSHALLGNGADWRAEQAAENQRVADEIARIQREDTQRKQRILNQLNQERIAELHEAWATKETEWELANPEPKESDFPEEDDPDGELFKKAHEEWVTATEDWHKANPEPLNVDALSASDKSAIDAALNEKFEPTDTSGIVAAKIKEPKIGAGSKTPVRVPSIVHFSSVSIGSENVYALDVLNRLWTWGNDKNGQTALGLNEDTHTHRPVMASNREYSSVYAGDKMGVAAGAGLYSWGLNSKLNLLQSNEAKLLEPTKISDGNFAKLSSNGSTIVAIQDSGAATAWGSNENGIAGVNSDKSLIGFTPIEGRFKDISLASKGSLALSSNAGNLYFWGSDKDGVSAADKQITEPVIAPQRHVISKFIDVAAGRLSSHAVDANGFVWTWGMSWMGSIAYPAKEIASPTQVPLQVKVTKIAASQSDVMMLTEKNELLWWGSHSENGNITGVEIPEGLKLEEVRSLVAGKDNFLMLDQAGAVYAYSTNYGLGQLHEQTPKTLKKVELPGEASSITAGGLGNLAVIDGVAYGWGDNENLQINPTNEASYIATPEELPAPYTSGWASMAISSTHLLGVSEKGVLYGWGHSNYIEGLGTKQAKKPIHLAINVEEK